MSNIFLPALMAAALLLLPRSPASADNIYQYTDSEGVVHFSNIGVGNSNKYKTIKSERAQKKPARVSSQVKPVSSGKAPSAYIDIINVASERHGIDPALVHAVVKVESDFNPYALSRKGAMGLMQLMPQTAADMNVRNSFNPRENIDGGVRYLRYLIDRYDGNLSLALAAYNSGEGTVNKWGAIPPYRETQNYVRRIMKLYNGRDMTYSSHNTIYISYGKDGSLLMTDNPQRLDVRGRRRAANL